MMNNKPQIFIFAGEISNREYIYDSPRVAVGIILGGPHDGHLAIIRTEKHPDGCFSIDGIDLQCRSEFFNKSDCPYHPQPDLIRDDMAALGAAEWITHHIFECDAFELISQLYDWGKKEEEEIEL